MAVSPGWALALLRTPEGRKMFRYSMASVVALGVSVVCLTAFELLGWGPVLSSTLATVISAVPSYEMNRRWAWGRTGKGHVWREVVPFWAIALVGWAFATYSVRLAETSVGDSLGHLLRVAVVVAVYVGAYGVLWVGKFVVFNKVLFAGSAEGITLGEAEIAG